MPWHASEIIVNSLRALTTGMPPAEYLGLKWQDVDWVRQTIGVCSQPSGHASPAFTLDIRLETPSLLAMSYGPSLVPIGSITVS